MGPTYRLGGYAEWTAPRDLEGVLERSWVFEACAEPPEDRPDPSPMHGTAHAIHRVIPHTGVSLAVRGWQDGATGFRADALLVLGSAVTPRFFAPEAGEVLVAVRLHPEWCEAVLGVAPEEFTDRIVPVHGHAAWARTFTTLRGIEGAQAARRALEDFVRDRRGEVRSDRRALLAHRGLARLRAGPAGAQIRRVARDEGVSERTFRRVVRTRTGLQPKQIHRIERLGQVVVAADAVDHPSWSGLAYRFGFSDQAHLGREVRALTGCSPVELHGERSAQQPRSGRRHARPGWQGARRGPSHAQDPPASHT